VQGDNGTGTAFCVMLSTSNRRYICSVTNDLKHLQSWELYGDNMTNEQLIEHIRAGDDTAIEQLYLQNTGIIWKLARATACKHADTENQRKYLQEELQQEAYFGLLEAVNRWDSEQGASFMGYAVFWIRQAMTRYCYHVKGPARIPEARQAQIRRYAQIMSDSAGSVKPSDSEVCRMMEIDMDTLKEVKAASVLMKPVSMEQAVKGDTEGITLADTIADVHDRYEEAMNRINREELAGVLWPMVDSLPARQALVIRQQYQAGLSVNEISRLFGISCKELKADRQRALVALSHYRNKAKLKAFYDGLRYSNGLKGGLKSWERTRTSPTERAAIEFLSFELNSKERNCL